jgi:hypothetical protein
LQGTIAKRGMRVSDGPGGRRGRPLALALAGCVLALSLGGCGGGSGQGQRAATLLRQTFGGTHKVLSGRLDVELRLTPSGSRTLSGPISLSFSGPFQSRGTGKLPASNFTVSLSGDGQTGSLGIVSTGTHGYVTLSGTSYQLPAASFRNLESGFSRLGGSGGGSGGGPLSQLGIDPLHWLSDATVVGSADVGGATTTHIRARIDVAALLADLNTFLAKAPSLGISGAAKLPHSISDATRRTIVGELHSPTFDVWTGDGDRTVRRLVLGLTLPVTGRLSTVLGGLRSARLELTFQYSDLNRPQTIATPTNVKPYGQFQAKVSSLVTALEGQAAAGALGGSSGSSAAGGGGSRYDRCITAAGQDVKKMQRCAGLVGK